MLIKNLLLVLGLILGTVGFAQTPDFANTKLEYDHGGRNGGDGLEIEISKMAIQITRFLNTTTGQANFQMINLDFLNKVSKNLDIDITTEEIVDRYGVSRTAVNIPEQMKIIVNANRWALVKDPSVLYVLVFHEILGLMELELGHENNVSLYPISSRLLGFYDVVSSIEVAPKEMRPEYYKLKNSSYGNHIINKDTQETLRLVCLDNVEIHQCQKFNLVRANGTIQKPLVEKIKELSLNDLFKLEQKLNSLEKRDYLTKDLKKVAQQSKKILNAKGDISEMGKEIKLDAKTYQSNTDLIFNILMNK